MGGFVVKCNAYYVVSKCHYCIYIKTRCTKVAEQGPSSPKEAKLRASTGQSLQRLLCQTGCLSAQLHRGQRRLDTWERAGRQADSEARQGEAREESRLAQRWSALVSQQGGPVQQFAQHEEHR